MMTGLFIDRDRLTYAKHGPFRIISSKGQARGASVVLWQIVYGQAHAVSVARSADENYANQILKEMNDAYTLWCMVRGTAAEKEHFPD